MLLGISISVDAKKKFILWFLENYELQLREETWLLNYLLANDEILSNIHFVEGARYCPRAIVMSAKSSLGKPFHYFKENQIIRNVERTFHDLRLHTETPVYMEIQFKDALKESAYLQVLEDNPYKPQPTIREEDSALAAQIIAASEQQFYEQQLVQAIDHALDTGDKEAFLQYSKKLQEFRKSL